MPDLTTSLPPFLPESATRRITLPSRPLKMCLAVSIGAVGLYGVLSDRQYVSTTEAIVSAYVLDVRTPIQGTLRDLPATAGDSVEAGASLGMVGNALIDHQHLDNIRITEEVARSRANALARERGLLVDLRQKMLSRAALHTDTMVQRLSQQVEQANALFEAKQIASKEATVELDRGRKLAEWGVLSKADLGRLASAQAISSNEFRAQEQNLASLQTQFEAARRGVLSEPGTNNDVAYSAQRADELVVKLVENAGELEAAEAQAHQAHEEVYAEARRASLLGSSEVRAPSAGRIWKLYAINGEHIEADAPVVSIVDCSRQFVLAEVPQDRVSTLLLNSKAEIMLTGESASRAGTVMAFSSDQQNRLDAKLAAVPVKRSNEDLTTVVIRLDNPPGATATSTPCLVGRTARVRLPTRPTNLLTLWLSQRL